MGLNRNKLIELLKTEFDGNYSKLARELGIDISHLYRFLNTGVGGGRKMLVSVIALCKRRGLNFDNYLE